MQNKFAVIAMIMVIMIGITGIVSASPYDEKVSLDNKDPSTWMEIDDMTYATVYYSSVGEEFAWNIVGKGLTPNTGYSLIYYADPWPGNNPGALIAAFTTDGLGVFNEFGYTELNMDLPHPDDYNANPDPDYCNHSNGFDDYEHCCGAKLWVVLTEDYNEPAMEGWNPAEYLFETDLITYEDCDDYFTPSAVPENATFSIGDVFNYSVASVPIMVLNATNAGAVDVTLTYNASVLSFNDASGDAMDNVDPSSGDGWVRIGAFQMGSPGMNGDFTLADISFDVVGEGTCDFAITVTTYKDATPCGRSMPYLMDIGICCPCENGDVNCDGDVDIFDAMYLAKHVLNKAGFESIVECAADVDGSGNIDIADASRLAGCVLGKENYCPLE